MLRAISLAVVLGLFWIGLSGLFTPLLLGLGAASAIVIVWLTLRAGACDPEGLPLRLLPNALWYWPWLLWQILGSGLAVARIIVRRRLAISPTLVEVCSSQRTAAGKVTYANSITLTPGTVAVELGEGHILVHALTREGAEDLAAGRMGRMVSRFEGRRR